MRDGLITLTDAGAAPVALTANRTTIDRLPGDVISNKVEHPPIIRSGPPAAASCPGAADL